MLRTLIRCGAVAGVVGLGACKLEVINPNSPATVQVKLTPADLENFLGTQFRRWHASLHGTVTNIWGMANVMSFENFSTLSNNCQGQRVGIPRPGNDNAVGNACGPEQLRVFTQASEAARSVSDVLAPARRGPHLRIRGAGPPGAVVRGIPPRRLAGLPRHDLRFCVDHPAGRSVDCAGHRGAGRVCRATKR